MLTKERRYTLFCCQIFNYKNYQDSKYEKDLENKESLYPVILIYYVQLLLLYGIALLFLTKSLNCSSRQKIYK
jgi:hypothetical protein